MDVKADCVLQVDPLDYLKEIFHNNAEKIFLIDNITGKKLTYADLHQGACSVASKLISLGLKKGDKISIICKNSEFLVRLYFACLYSGIVVVPINPILNPREIQYIVENSNSQMILYDDDSNKIDIEYFLNKEIILYNLNQKKLLLLHQEKIIDFDISDNDLTFLPFCNVSSNDDMAIVYTSGTTSAPKGVIHTIFDFINNAYEFGKLVGLTSRNRFYNLLPLTYLGGYFNLIIIPYVHGCSVVLDKAFDSKSILNFWAPIIKNQVNSLWLIPSIISILLEFDRGNNGIDYCFKNIDLILCGTAPLPIPIKKIFEEQYGVKILENYGLTETFFISTNTNTKISEHNVGQILPSVQIQITEDDQILKNDKEGEIEIKSPFLAKKYLQNIDDTFKSLHNNDWFKTGDLGYVSKNNEIFITGRKKDLIIRSGINISPLSIENILYTHPDIRECAVVGIPHKFQGEEIICVVSLKSENDFEIIKKELFELCDKELSTIKKPSKILSLSELPHTTSGKIQKRKIKAWITQHSSISHTIPSFESHLKPDQLSNIAKNSIQALSIKYNNLVYERQRNGEDIIVLSLGEAFFDIPLYSFDDLPLSKIFHYSHSRGIPELREDIGKYFAKNYDVVFDSEHEILITAGSKIAIHMVLMTLINPNDEIIIYEPAWVSYPEQIKLCHGIPVSIPHDKNIFDFEDYVSDKTKAIIVNNPNNPSGRVFNLEEMSYIYNLAKKHGFFVISDEAYSDFVINRDEFISFGNLDIEKTHTIIINSISKNFGISGWRLGYLISNPQFIEQVLKINQHLITCPPTILQYYVHQYFNQIIDLTKPQIIDLLKKRKNIEIFMNEIDLEFLPGTSTFYFFILIKKSNLLSIDFCDALLNDYHVSAAPGIGYGKSCDSFIRIGIGSEDFERIKTGLLKIKDLINKTQNH